MTPTANSLIIHFKRIKFIHCNIDALAREKQRSEFIFSRINLWQKLKNNRLDNIHYINIQISGKYNKILIYVKDII